MKLKRLKLLCVTGTFIIFFATPFPAYSNDQNHSSEGDHSQVESDEDHHHKKAKKKKEHHSSEEESNKEGKHPVQENDHSERKNEGPQDREIHHDHTAGEHAH